MAERCAPELLPYPEELIDRVVERIKTQVSKASFLNFLFVSVFCVCVFLSFGFFSGVVWERWCVEDRGR